MTVPSGDGGAAGWYTNWYTKTSDKGMFVRNWNSADLEIRLGLCLHVRGYKNNFMRNQLTHINALHGWSVLGSCRRVDKRERLKRHQHLRAHRNDR